MELPNDVLRTILARTDRDTRRSAALAGIFHRHKTPKSQRTLSASAWAAWEADMHALLDDPKILGALSPSKHLTGHVSPNSGRMSFNTLRTKQDFGQFSYAVVALTQRDFVLDILSLAAVLPGAQKRYLVLHPHMEDPDDVDTMASLCSRVRRSKGKAPVFGLCILDAEPLEMSHGTAYIAWEDAQGTVNLAFYDPISYRRKKKRNDGTVYYDEYDYMKVVLDWVQSEPDAPAFRVHDLSQYCVQRNGEEFDCPQYYMNAEICTIYSLYFLYAWVAQGKPTTGPGLSQAVHKAYIVEPTEVKRAYTASTLRFRIVMMSFLLSVFARYLEILPTAHRRWIDAYHKIVAHVAQFSDSWHHRTGIPIRM